MDELEEYKKHFLSKINKLKYNYTLDLNDPEDVAIAINIHENFIETKEAGDEMYLNKLYKEASVFYEMALACYPAHVEVKKLLEFSRSAALLQRST